MAIFNTVYGGSGGGGGGWQPGANTIAYYKFDGNLNDSSGNGRNATNNGTISYKTSPNAVTLSTSSYLSISSMPQFTNDRTVNCWVNRTARPSEYSFIYAQGGGAFHGQIMLGVSKADKLFYGFLSDDYTGTSTMNLNQWYNLTFTYNYTTRNFIGYINGIADINGTLSSQYSITTTTGYMGAIANNLGVTGFRMIGDLSEFIMENKERTAQEIADYYNLTKSNYGL